MTLHVEKSLAIIVAAVTLVACLPDGVRVEDPLQEALNGPRTPREDDTAVDLSPPPEGLDAQGDYQFYLSPLLHQNSESRKKRAPTFCHKCHHGGGGWGGGGWGGGGGSWGGGGGDGGCGYGGCGGGGGATKIVVVPVTIQKGWGGGGGGHGHGGGGGGGWYPQGGGCGSGCCSGNCGGSGGGGGGNSYATASATASAYSSSGGGGYGGHWRKK